MHGQYAEIKVNQRILPMRINVKQHVLDYEGRPLLVDKTDSNGQVVFDGNGWPVKEPETARQYLVTALNNKGRNENEPLGAEESAKRYQLSLKLYAKNQVDLTFDEASLLKARIVDVYGDLPLIVGRISDMLEGKSADATVETEANDGPAEG